MISMKIIFARVMIVAPLIILGCMIYIIGFGDNRYRVEMEHGIDIPLSARDIQCRGDAWKLLLDRGALAMFTISADDLDMIVNQFNIINARTSIGSLKIDPTAFGRHTWLGEYENYIPTNVSGKPLKNPAGRAIEPVKSIYAKSETGDWSFMEIYRIDSERLLIKLYTDWN